ncbi:MAG TPA: MSMEG_4193 family putative phosphomutase [Marmoricola sp.]|nr:MSMEG_4193 family putative phosphomutase [Marmoricola sp.]
MATVILARHGRTAANASGVLAGRTKGVLLDERGLEQARAAAARLDGLRLAAVVSSPLERCRDTAKVFLAGRDLTVQTDRRLLECDYGDWTGQEIRKLAKEPLWRTVQATPSAARFPGGESMAAMSARAVAAVRDLDEHLQREAGKDAVWVAVSHGDVIKAILADALGMHLDSFQRIVVDPASLSVVRYTPQRAFVVTMNSTAGSLAHLAPPKRRRRRAVPAGDAVLGGGAGPETESA